MDDLSGRIDAVVDAGPTPIGIESTIVACLGAEARVLRPGGIPRGAIQAVLGRTIAAADGDGAQPGGFGEKPLAPGMLASHYAPRAAVRLDAAEISEGEAALLFGPAHPAGLDRAVAVLNLSIKDNLAEAAANLFGHLRALDASGARAIAVAPIPTSGLGEAINDRLRRAAAPR
jgi:L-threonylcarbamoyladenylate synthase